MYDPKGNSVDKTVSTVRFQEATPPARLQRIVHRFLELKTEAPLAQDYRFHALPDACTYAVFDQRNAQVAGITRLKASSEELSLGRAFHFLNIRFLPGTWQRDKAAVAYGLVERPYNGPLPLAAVSAQLAGQDLSGAVPILSAFVETLMARGILVENPVTAAIFAQIDSIFSVTDMAEAAELSPRQLQRVLKQTTGFTPHDFLKILRLQQSLLGEPSLGYADQSHFIRSFRAATGYTPGQFAKKFDV